MKIDLDNMKEDLKNQLPSNRYIHSLGVAESAIKLARQIGIDPIKAEIAGLLHDIAKYWPKEKLREIIMDSKELSIDLLSYDSELWHGPVASVFVQQEYGIQDMEIIAAIRFHTSGRENMTQLEKVICLADYIEPSRNFPGVDVIRDLARKDINEALLFALDGTITHLIQNRSIVYPVTLVARNSLLTEIMN